MDSARAGVDAASSATLAREAVRRRLAPVEQAAESEVRALMDATLTLMREAGTPRAPRVADIVSAAGLSNDAFYRYFASKDALLAAIVEDGARRLVEHVRHQVDKATDPREQLRAGIAAIMKQAVDPDIAAATRAVLGNIAQPPVGDSSGWTRVVDELVGVFRDPVARLGSSEPDRQARMVGTLAMATMQYFLWHAEAPPGDEVDGLMTVFLGGIA
jgi:AcrR family transcriptional regulator